MYSSAPDDLAWLPHGTSHACFYSRTPSKARAGDDLYSVNLLTGQVLRNGVPPSRLPAAIVERPDYVRLFGGLEFGVTDDLVTRHSIHGRFYRFQLDGERLAVFEMRTSSGDGEVLELLPGASARARPSGGAHACRAAPSLWAHSRLCGRGFRHR